jgi:cob(I)alamin adenosyltransferase
LRILALRQLGLGLEAISRVLESQDRRSLIETLRRQLLRVEIELETGKELRARLERLLELLEQPDADIEQVVDEMEVMKMIKLDQIYTRLGDSGKTQLADLTRVPKTDPRIEAGGAVDELAAHVGRLLADGALGKEEHLWLARVANDLFDLGADLGVPFDSADKAQPRILADYVSWLESACDEAKEGLQTLDCFVAWYEVPLAAELDVCRVVCRRAERRILAVQDINPEIVRYLNRLSDLLYILSRRAAKNQEVLWKPGRGAEMTSR